MAGTNDEAAVVIAQSAHTQHPELCNVLYDNQMGTGKNDLMVAVEIDTKACQLEFSLRLTGFIACMIG